MNRFTRMLTMAGLGLATGVAFGAGPAAATPNTDQGTARSEISAGPWGNDKVVGYFPSYRSCDRAGDFGEDEGFWEDYDCYRVGSGFHFRRYALVVDYDDWGHGWSGHWSGHSVGQWWPGNHHGGHWWGHRPGGFFPGKPGGFFPGKPGGFFPGRPPFKPGLGGPSTFNGGASPVGSGVTS
jgi:hypothetical protein